MGKYVLVVNSNAVEGKEAEYNQWYDKVHLGEVISLPGFVAAQRFKTADVAPVTGGKPTHEYLAIYELETDTPQACMDALGNAVSSGEMTMSDSINTEDASACLYGPITERVTA